MTSTTQSSTPERPKIDPLGNAVTLSPGPYEGYWQEGRQPFAVEVDAKPLAVLVDAAFIGSRVYEFMAISRPGDIYCYLRVCPTDVSETVAASVQELISNTLQREEWGDGYVPLNRFDKLFYRDGEDTRPESSCWLGFRSGTYWKNTALELLAWAKATQQELRSMGDLLTLREIRRIDKGIHRLDFMAEIERRCLAIALDAGNIPLPDAVLTLIDELITRDNVQSVSAPYSDYRLWRRLCTEQLVRSERTGYPPEEAFTLSGPDGALWCVPLEDWGADVHIPYEGVCMADLLIQPDWRRALPENDAEDAQLVSVFNGSWGYSPKKGWMCHYVLTPDDLGQLACANRTEVGDGWVLYESKQPYIPNPRCKPHLLTAYENDD